MRSTQEQKKTIPSFRYVTCPACNKPRLLKEIQEDGTLEAVSTDTVEVRGETRHVDACNFCIIKYEKADRRFVMDNLKKIQKAATSTNRDDLKDSDHKDFSLDI